MNRYFHVFINKNFHEVTSVLIGKQIFKAATLGISSLNVFEYLDSDLKKKT